MPEGYYCPQCQKFVSIMQGLFIHLHLGMKTCYVCRKCGGMVYIKEQRAVSI